MSMESANDGTAHWHHPNLWGFAQRHPTATIVCGTILGLGALVIVSVAGGSIDFSEAGLTINVNPPQ